MRATLKSYTPEFRADALELVHRGDRSIRKVADDLGINHWTLRHWFREDRMKRDKTRPRAPQPPPPPATESAEQTIARLEREVAQLKKVNAQLEMDRAILKNRLVRRPCL